VYFKEDGQIISKGHSTW